MRYVTSNGYVYFRDLYFSTGRVLTQIRGVRPVVSLKINIRLKERTDGSYDLK